MPANLELQRQLGSIEELFRKVDQSADPALRTAVQELVGLVMTLHGAALERILELAWEDAFVEKLGRDELVASLLVLHGLHPLSLEDRVAEAIDKAGARLRPHGGGVQLMSMQGGVVRVRLSVKGCGSSEHSLKEMVEQSIYEAAPDVTAVVIEGIEENQGFVRLESLLDHSLAKSAGKGRV
jgi:Fe-S cluster biogenesis protein NfuA